jgi:hypothetical protein
MRRDANAAISRFSSDEVVDKALRELKEGREQFERIVARRRAGIPELQAKINLFYHAHFRLVKVGVGIPDSFCAIFEADCNVVEKLANTTVGEEVRSPIGVHLVEDDIQHTVFVPFPHLVEDIQPRLGPAVVKWLRSLDDCRSAIIDASDHFRSPFLVVLTLPTDGHTCDAFNWLGHELPDDMIERRPHLAYGFSSNYRVTSEEVARSLEVQDALAGLKIATGREAIAIKPPVPLKLKLELFEVLIGPVKLSPGTIMWVHSPSITPLGDRPHATTKLIGKGQRTSLEHDDRE